MRAFKERPQPADPAGGLQSDDHWVWCGSPIRGEDGRYHLFASIWSRETAFTPFWLTHSRIVRAEAETPDGPYRLAGEVLPPRDPEAWDGRMTHNPTIHRIGNRYALFYTGTTYVPEPPAADDPSFDNDSDLRKEARRNQRIGVAWADDLGGPWERPDEPLLQPRPGRWDALLTTNAAYCHDPVNDRHLLYYKSTPGEGGPLQYSVCAADDPRGPYRRLREDPLDPGPAGASYEDAYVWHEDGVFQMLCKDQHGDYTGEAGSGVHAWSDDGIHWQTADPVQAYSRTVRWTDGSTTTLGAMERPQLLIEDGRPTWLFTAAGDGPGGYPRSSRTWSQAFPLD